MEQKNPVWLFYSAFDDVRITSVRCLDCNTELSAKVLRWKSFHEKCPWQGRKVFFCIFFQWMEHKTCTNISIHHKNINLNFQSTAQIRIDQY